MAFKMKGFSGYQNSPKKNVGKTGEYSKSAAFQKSPMKQNDDEMEKLRKELTAAGSNVDKRNAVMRKIRALMMEEGVEGADKPRIYDAETGDTKTP